LVAEPDGSQIYRAEHKGSRDLSGAIGIKLAEKLMAQGAMRIIEKLQLESL